ncbi:MAG: hypothetical protein AAGJ93_07225, partial [Bacteroidota bacterium]
MDIVAITRYIGEEEELLWYEFLAEENTYTEKQLLLPFFEAATFFFARLDQDIYPDIIYSIDDQLYWRKNTLPGQPGFGVSNEISLESPSPDLLLTNFITKDFDGDGDTDVLISYAESGSLAKEYFYWYENTADASLFTPHFLLEAKKNRWSLNNLRPINEDTFLDFPIYRNGL